MRKICYRYVPFGTTFNHESRQYRPKAEDFTRKTPKDFATLYSNEIALDIGSECNGWDGCEAMVLDHHFQRDNQFPCAAAEVLHKTKLIAEFNERLPEQECIWLVTHQNPDFDAYSSCYLARKIIEGNIDPNQIAKLELAENSWGPIPEKKYAKRFDWFNPFITDLDGNLRWPVLIAAYAARTDAALSVDVPRNRSLHGILYACIQRGRPYEKNAAYSFFEQVREQLVNEEISLNPIFDSIFEDSDPFKHELKLLDQQEEAYSRDLQKARKSLVCVPCSSFESWYPGEDGISTKPLLISAGSVERPQLNEAHANAGSVSQVTLDGIYIRDPECMLFKEYARMDLENSSRGQGFTFTAVAYSGAKPQATNTSDYYFSLDPEKANNAHLYHLWAHLEFAEEQRGSIDYVDPNNLKGRTGFTKRTTNPDPWFDGNNSRATIIATPGKGTQLKEGVASDLLDDEVAQLVSHMLELEFFEGNLFEVVDIPTHPILSEEKKHFISITESCNVGYDSHCLRVAVLKTRKGINFFNHELAEQLGSYMWQVIEDPGTVTLPKDFLDNHIVNDSHVLGVWNRRGVVIACQDGDETGAKYTEDLVKSFRYLASIIWRMRSNLEKPNKHNSRTLELLNDFLSLKLSASQPSGRLLRYFLNGTHSDSLLEAVHAVAREQENERNGRKEKIIGSMAAIFIFPSLVLGFFDAVGSVPIGWGIDLASDWKWIGLISLLSIIPGWTGLALLNFCLKTKSKKKKKSKR